MKASWLVAAVAFLGMTGGLQAASAADAYTTTDVNMRAGPSTRFPRITMLPAGAAVSVYGCTRSWDWCDTDWQGLRGWVSAHYLESLYHDRRVVVPDYGRSMGLPIITFEFGRYWDRWYPDRPWYHERDRWEREWSSGWDNRVDRSRRARVVERGQGVRRGDIPPGHLPPPGHCRDWDPSLPPGHQPPPYPC